MLTASSGVQTIERMQATSSAATIIRGATTARRRATSCARRRYASHAGCVRADIRARSDRPRIARRQQVEAVQGLSLAWSVRQVQRYVRRRPSARPGVETRDAGMT